MNILQRGQFICSSILFSCISLQCSSGEDRWWPVQLAPKALVRLEERDFQEPHAAYAMTAQSVAGLAAKAVNEGRSDEMVWIGTGNIDIEDWLARLLKRRPDLNVRGTTTLWNLVDQYASNGIIRGYILYRDDHSKGELNQHRRSMDFSVNVATSLAGILDGIIVDEALEGAAKQHGLKMLLDVREKTQAWCFNTYKSRFTRRMLCTQDPRKPNVRDLAIAQKTMTLYGFAEPAPSAMDWLEPLSPILGWNGDDEFKTTQMSSVRGHLQTSTDWAMNLPVLMAGTESSESPKVRNLDPRTIDWKDVRSGVTFIQSDGDNVDFLEGSFFRGVQGQSYWGNPHRGRIPFGWSSCFAHLMQLCPEAIDYAAVTQSTNDWFLEWGGGYYYPDLFGRFRTNRWDLLAQHARRTWSLMKRTNVRVIGFNVSKIDSPEALKAYQVFSEQTDGLLAILVWQYDCYEAGAGRVFWVKDRKGIDVPVISARYSIWNHTNTRPRSGTPTRVAREIRQSVEITPSADLPRYDWVNLHAWSWFRHVSGRDENAEDMLQENAQTRGGERGYSPAMWCVQRLPDNIRTVAPEEMFWRIRMKHDPRQTVTLIRDWTR